MCNPAPPLKLVFETNLNSYPFHEARTLMQKRAGYVGSAQQIRRDRLIRERVHDTYKMRSKPPEPTVCPDCHAVFQKGRWQWATANGHAEVYASLCPACHRIRDRCPGGYLSLGGAFFQAHADEILHLARNVEAREKGAHPLRRIMGVESRDGGVEITTTDMGLARDIGEAINDAYKGGELDYEYTNEANILQVSWTR